MDAELESVYRNQRASLLAIARNITGCVASAEDAVHNAFSSLVESPTIPDDLVSYVFRAVRNAAYDVVRRSGRDAKRRESLFERRQTEHFPDVAPQALDELVNGEDAERIRKALNSLSEQERELVVLKVFAGRTFASIGQITNRSPNTVATQFRRLMMKLQLTLQDCRTG